MQRKPTLRPGSAATFDAAVGALVVLVLAIERMPSGPKAVGYRDAIRRQGRMLADAGGPEMMQAVLKQIGQISPARRAARRAIIVSAWSSLRTGAA